MQNTKNAVRADDFQTARTWLTDRASNLFPSHASFEWFVRRHRAELIESGEFIPRKGRGGAIVGPEIDRVVIEIIRREAGAA